MSLIGTRAWLVMRLAATTAGAEYNQLHRLVLRQVTIDRLLGLFQEINILCFMACLSSLHVLAYLCCWGPDVSVLLSGSERVHEHQP